MPETITLSAEALALLRHRLATKDTKVTAKNLEAYRELARAGIMEPVSGMFGGPESTFRFTSDGWSRRDEYNACVGNAGPDDGMAALAWM
jgi:hypothetical protein